MIAYPPFFVHCGGGVYTWSYWLTDLIARWNSLVMRLVMIVTLRSGTSFSFPETLGRLRRCPWKWFCLQVRKIFVEIGRNSGVDSRPMSKLILAKDLNAGNGFADWKMRLCRRVFQVVRWHIGYHVTRTDFLISNPHCYLSYTCPNWNSLFRDL